MTPRQRFGRLYRDLVKQTQRLGVRRLPVRLNGEWTTVPAGMWDGFVAQYEPYLGEALGRLVRPGGVFLDVGAHFGVWSAHAARLVGPGGLVVACEPSPAFAMLRANLGGRGNVRLLNVAVGAGEGEVDFHAQGLSTSGSVLASVTEINRHFLPDVAVTPLRVRMTTLDHVVAEVGRAPAVVKVDVEGYEVEVLRGAAGLLAGGRCTWVIEVHPPQLALSGSGEEELRELLARHGLAAEVLHRQPNSLYTLVAARRPPVG
jgi:FkbM family methyltransferase